MVLRFIARGLKAKYKHEKQEIKALVEGLQTDDIAIDVGANKGGYLWSLSRAVPQGRVFAFEPQPIFHTYLKKVCAQAFLRNVQVEPLGLSDRTGVFTLAIPGSDPTSPAASFEDAVKSREPHQSYEVQVTTLDRYFENIAGHVGAIKIDVEGHELAVLKGGLNLLKKHKPVIVCESENRHITHGSVSDVLKFITDLGYEGWVIQQERLLPLALFDPLIHQSQVGDQYWESPAYCNNFIFKPLPA